MHGVAIHIELKAGRNCVESDITKRVNVHGVHLSLPIRMRNHRTHVQPAVSYAGFSMHGSTGSCCCATFRDRKYLQNRTLRCVGF